MNHIGNMDIFRRIEPVKKIGLIIEYLLNAKEKDGD